MKQIAVMIAALSLLTAPVAAQEQAPENPDLSQGAELLSEGMKLILRGIATELEPLEEGWAEFLSMLDDLNAYHPPEMLPNGDIIIRRKVPLVPEDEGGETDI